MKIGVRESALSFAIFGGMVFALMSVDPNVRERLGEMFSGGGVAHLGDRAGDSAGCCGRRCGRRASRTRRWSCSPPWAWCSRCSC